MSGKKAIIELIVVLVLVTFGLWMLYKDSNSGLAPGNAAESSSRSAQ